MKDHTLDRFLEAQSKNYDDALTEVKNGKKTSHWMWYVFPQLRALGNSDTAKFYGIENLEEATSFYQHQVLGDRLISISSELLELESNDAFEIFGSPDYMKLKSCMTLFSSIPNASDVFEKVLAKFYDGQKDQNTIDLIS